MDDFSIHTKSYAASVRCKKYQASTDPRRSVKAVAEAGAAALLLLLPVLPNMRRSELPLLKDP